jgi:iron complex outermembrane receptor protein
MSLGVVLTPWRSFNTTIDGYVVNVDHRIALTGLLSGPAVNNILVTSGFSPGLTGQYFTNAINTRTIGADIVSTYSHDVGKWGILALNLAANFNKTDITHIIANPPALASLGPSYVLFDQQSQGYLTSSLPRTKVSFGITWGWHRINVDLHEIRYGSYSIINDTSALDRTFPAAWITNIALDYHVTPRVSVIVGADNVFNVYPPATNVPFLSAYGYNQYPRISPFGFTGGSYYGRLQIEF